MTRKVWFTADWHLGDERMDIFDRPFASIEAMHEFLIAAHNALVAPDDLVIHLGDVTRNTRPEFLPMVRYFNGEKVLLRGNHDRVHSDADLTPFFSRVYPEGQVVMTEVPDLTVAMVHYPTLAVPDYFTLVGHIHAVWKMQPNMLNVGVDVHWGCPVAAEQIAGFFRAVREFYDQDVWLLDHPANQPAIERLRRQGIGSYADSLKKSQAPRP